MFLLSSDWHLDENEANEYRWQAFQHTHDLIDKYNITEVFVLGDILDRKDRFSGRFVNRLVGELRRLGTRRPLWILKGNHDDPMSGPAFFQFVNGMIPGVRYVIEPTPVGSVMLLPFASDPVEAWRGIPWTEFRAAFMHITVTGAISENGTAMEGDRLPILPRQLILYSGDVHNPQTIRNLTYVGCPHPVKFGDRFQPRMLILDAETLEIDRVVEIESPRKLVAQVSSIEDLDRMQLRPGDQVRVRVTLAASDVDGWGALERAIQERVAAAGAALEGTEVVVEVAPRIAGRDADPESDPAELLRQFAGDNGITAELLDLGLDIVKEAMG